MPSNCSTSLLYQLYTAGYAPTHPWPQSAATPSPPPLAPLVCLRSGYAKIGTHPETLPNHRLDAANDSSGLQIAPGTQLSRFQKTARPLTCRLAPCVQISAVKHQSTLYPPEGLGQTSLTSVWKVNVMNASMVSLNVLLSSLTHRFRVILALGGCQHVLGWLFAVQPICC